MRSQKLILTLLAVFSFFSCAGRPNLVNYPSREIDRPAIVPEGLSKWYIFSSLVKSKDDVSSDRNTIDVSPLSFESSLSENWSLLWSPLPFGVKYQFFNTEQNRLAFLTFLGFSYGTGSGLKLFPNFALYYRLKLTSDFGFDIEPFFDPLISYKDGQKYRWTAGFSAGPLFQLSDSVSIKPVFLYNVFRGQPAIESFYSDDDQTQYRTGLGLRATVNLNRQWTFEPSYKYLGLSSPNGYRSDEVNLNFIHIW